MADMDTYEAEPRSYPEGTRRSITRAFNNDTKMHYEPADFGRNNDRNDYPRERSRSPGPDRDGDSRIRDEPSNGRGDRGPSSQNGGGEDAINPGSNLFVTGIHPRLSEEEITALFEKYGNVEKCNIMRDPHTRESRGFGFVKMVTSDGADAAKDGLQGQVYEGRTLSIEKARRARPRTPTPGKYFGPPKRDEPRGGGRFGGGGRDRYHDDRGYGGGRRDEYRRGGYRDRYDDRDRYEDRDRGYGRRDEYAPRSDRYASRDDRYTGERRGGGYGGSGGYERSSRGAPAGERGGYSGAADSSAGGPPPARDYDDRRRYD